jgi:hypothetical protein
MTRASRLWSRIVGGVEQDEESSEHGRPSGSRAVIDPHAAARLSAVIRDGEFDEQVPEGASGYAARGFASAPSAIPRAVPATAVATLAIACLWASGRDFAEISRRSTHAATAGGSFGTSRAAAGPMFGAGRDPGTGDGDQAMSAKNRMRAAVVAAAAATGSALAQDAVQWRVEDGGNGHWYAALDSNGMTFMMARSMTAALGGDLVTLQTPQENEFVFVQFVSNPEMWWDAGGIPRHGPWVGLVQDPTSADYSEPAGGWMWLDGTPLTYSAWAVDPCESQPTNCFCGGAPCGLNNAGYYTGGIGKPIPQPTWGSFASDMSGNIGGVIIEWSADCNNDGIVDYGQIRAGQLPDADANGVPDCCDSNLDCCIGDIYRDGVINGADLGIVLADWGPAVPTKPSDLDGNGRVDGADLGMLLANWGACGG